MNTTMVEVFKTNVKNPDHARMILDQIHATFGDYSVNFDLDDCDKILRVESQKGFIEVSHLLHRLKLLGIEAEVLSDDKPVNEVFQF